MTDSSKRRRVQPIVKLGAERVTSSGRPEAAKLLKESLNSPTRAKKINDAWESSKSLNFEVFTDDEALALSLAVKLTKTQYILLI